MNLGTKIREIRSLKKLSQENMAAELGISQKAYSDIEANKTNIPISTIEKIANVFDLKMEDIINFNSDKIFNLTNNEVANGYVKNLYLDNKEILKDLKVEFQLHIDDVKHNYEQHLSDLKEEIKFLRDQLSKK